MIPKIQGEGGGLLRSKPSISHDKLNFPLTRKNPSPLPLRSSLNPSLI